LQLQHCVLGRTIIKTVQRNLKVRGAVCFSKAVSQDTKVKGTNDDKKKFPLWTQKQQSIHTNNCLRSVYHHQIHLQIRSVPLSNHTQLQWVILRISSANGGTSCSHVTYSEKNIDCHLLQKCLFHSRVKTYIAWFIEF